MLITAEKLAVAPKFDIMATPNKERDRNSGTSSIKDAPVPLERDVFLRTLIRHLTGTLQKVVGLEEASGMISLVGQQMGLEMNAMYKQALALENLTAAQVADVCVDLKRRIHGDFYVIDQNDERIIFGNRACPFAEKVEGRPALCMMTSNVFGSIAADSLGYSKVSLEKTIAKGDGHCRVVLYLKPTKEAEQAKGREYFRD